MRRFSEELFREELFLYEVMDESMIRICGCKEEMSSLYIPETIAGLPVVQIGDYAFKDMSILSEVHLPSKITYLGDHAFYGCGELKIISVYDGLRYVGDGVFKGCDKLCQVFFTMKRRNAAALRILISNVELDLRAELIYEEANGERTQVRLVYPAFYYDYIENYPARIFDEVVYGTGLEYRQCFKDGDVDYFGYDKLFLRCSREDDKDVPLWLCMGRLTSPYKLSQMAGDKYRAYLSEHGKEVLNLLIREKRPALLEEVLALDLFDEEMTRQMIDMAVVGKHTEFIGLMMNYQGRRFPARERRKKRFIL